MECAANQKTQGFGVEGDEVAMKSPDIFLERASLEDQLSKVGSDPTILFHAVLCKRHTPGRIP